MKKFLLHILGVSTILLFAACSLVAQSSSSSTKQLPDIKLKFGKGLQVVAADSSMAMKIGMRFQSLFNSERSLADGADWQSKFMIRRARLKFDGWAFNPNFVYKAEFALSNRDLGSSSDFDQTSEAPKVVLDAVVKWKFHKNFTLWVGQTKLPGNRERVVSSQKLQFVDRSLVNGTFTIDREMGVQLRGKFKSGNMVIKPMASFSLGEGRNTTINNIGGSRYVGRVELLPFGEFTSKGDYVQGDLKRENTPKFAIGATYSYNQGTPKQKTAGRFLIDAEGNYLENNLEVIFIDAVFKYQGFSVVGEFADRRVLGDMDADTRAALVDADGRSYYTGQGINTQISYLLKNNVEFAARYTNIMPDTEASFTGINEYTLGLSKYVVGHSLKVQADVSLIDQVGNSDNKLRYRLQTEFAF
ncbi:MAG: porin [Saprospiraceae bacterium]